MLLQSTKKSFQKSTNEIQKISKHRIFYISEKEVKEFGF